MVTNSLAEFGNNYSPRVLVEKSRRSHHDRGIFLRTVALQKLVRVHGIFVGAFGQKEGGTGNAGRVSAANQGDALPATWHALYYS